MCEASAYVLKNGQEELILQDVDLIEPDGENLRMVNIFGEQKVLKAEILSLNLVNHKVILVDGDPKRPAAAKPAGVRGERGKGGIGSRGAERRCRQVAPPSTESSANGKAPGPVPARRSPARRGPGRPPGCR